jgi:hypothetical protein
VYKWFFVSLVLLTICGSLFAAWRQGIVCILEESRAFANYKIVTAEVISSKINKYPSPKSHRRYYYEPIVEYRYSVDGKEYVSNRVAVLTRHGHNWSHTIVERYAKGKEVQAYYDPQNPSEAFLLREYYFGPYGNALIIMPLLVCGICMGIWVWTEWFKRRKPIAADNNWFEIKPEISIKSKFVESIFITFLWYIAGILLCGHYFLVADRPYSLESVIFSSIYGVAGVIPLVFVVRLWLLIRFLISSFIHLCNTWNQLIRTASSAAVVPVGHYERINNNPYYSCVR